MNDIFNSIAFFGSVISTNGISEGAVKKANEYIEKLLASLSPEVDKLTAAASGIVSIK